MEMRSCGPGVSGVAYSADKLTGLHPGALLYLLRFKVGIVNVQRTHPIVQPHNPAASIPIRDASDEGPRRGDYGGVASGEDVDAVVSSPTSLSRLAEAAQDGSGVTALDGKLERSNIANDHGALSTA
jgi:hypothetical protein